MPNGVKARLSVYAAPTLFDVIALAFRPGAAATPPVGSTGQQPCTKSRKNAHAHTETDRPKQMWTSPWLACFPPPFLPYPMNLCVACLLEQHLVQRPPVPTEHLAVVKTFMCFAEGGFPQVCTMQVSELCVVVASAHEGDGDEGGLLLLQVIECALLSGGTGERKYTHDVKVREACHESSGRLPTAICLVTPSPGFQGAALFLCLERD